MLVVTTGWALFNDKETVALAALAVGFLLTYLAHTGQVLSSFKGPAGMEGAFAELADTVTKVLDNPAVPEDVKVQSTDGLDLRSPQMPPAVVDAVRRTRTARDAAIAYEREVQQALAAVADEMGWQLETDPDLPYDARVSTGQDDLAIEIKWSRSRATPTQVARWTRELGAASQTGLIITNSQVTGDASGRCLQWTSKRSPDELRRALEEVLGRTSHD